MEIQGYWYPKNSSAKFKANLSLGYPSVTFAVQQEPGPGGSAADDPGTDDAVSSETISDGAVSDSAASPVDSGVSGVHDVDSIQISQRIGNIPRKIYFSDGSLFETADNDVIDEWKKTNGIQDSGRFVHKLESKWKLVGVTTVVCIAIIVGFFRWGLPATTDAIALALPKGLSEQVSKGAFETLDRFVFEPSELSDAQKEKVDLLFGKLVDRVNQNSGEDYQFALHFRKLGAPNALALPSGDIVVSDKLVEILTDPNEINSVFLHEFGHVVSQHGMKQIVRSSILSVVFALILGDISGLEEIFSGITSFLLQAQYSRNHESEADQFALEQMTRLRINPYHFAAALSKMTGLKVDTSNSKTGSSKNAMTYLSTHPDTEERIRNAMTRSEQYQHH